MLAGGPLLAEDCLPPGLCESLLTRKKPLKLDESAKINEADTRTMEVRGNLPSPPKTDTNDLLFVYLRKMGTMIPYFLHLKVMPSSGVSWRISIPASSCH